MRTLEEKHAWERRRGVSVANTTIHNIGKTKLIKYKTVEDALENVERILLIPNLNKMASVHRYEGERDTYKKYLKKVEKSLAG